MKNLQLIGKTEIEGLEIPEIAGGFGEGKKAMLAKDIAILHKFELNKVNQNINRNRSRFKDNVDIIDLKQINSDITLSDNELDNDFVTNLVSNEILTQNSINRAKNIYLLSQRGYAKLIKIFEDDLSWEMYDKLLDEYFEAKETVEETVQTNELESLSTINETANILLPLYEKTGMQPEYQLLTAKLLYKKGGIDIPVADLIAERELFDLTSIAVEVGLYSSTNNPHRQAIKAIIDKIDVLDEEKETVSFEKNGHMGTTTQYTKSVIIKIADWLQEHDYPQEIKTEKKTFRVVCNKKERVS